MNFKRYQFLKGQAVEKLRAQTTFPFPIAVEEGIDEKIVASEDSLMLAYIGDAVYSLYVRNRMVTTEITKVQILHTLVTEFICAKAQSKVMHQLEEELTEGEALVVRRARNSNVNVPKSATVQEYRSSTAFEALVGFLYRTAQGERLQTFLDKAFSIVLADL